MSDENTIDPKMFDFVSQMAHIFFGATLTFACMIFYPDYILYVLGVYVIATAVKEFWYDDKYENELTRGSSLLDFAAYQAGAWGALVLCLMKITGAL